jgi:hypothetical protein
MKKNVFSFYIVLTVIGLTSIFLFPARGRSECDRRDLSGICMDNPNVVIHYQEGSSVAAAENAAAGQPILISPWGETFTTTPTYTWYAVADATWYHLWVNHSTGTLGEKWYTAEEVGCPAGTGNCSLSPGTVLAPGTYTWWIQAWYNAYGPWSNGKPFYVDPNGKNCQNISSVGFTPVTSGMTYAASWGEKWRTGGTNYYFEAPVHLPVGAQITNVFLDYYDSNATQDVWLLLYDLVPGGSGSGYGTFSSGTPGYGRLELNFIYDYNLIVNNAGHSYFVSVGLMATDASNKFQGAIICYKPSP